MLRLLRALTVLAGLLALAGMIGFFYLRTTLPRVHGELTVDGLAGAVEVIRDRNAVPHIYAESPEDALLALGFVHAQDRLWQMELQRRLGAGRLAELVGQAALPTDRFLRTLSLYRYAEQAVEHLSPSAVRRLEAYVAGINRYLDTRSGPLPPEFLYFRHTPEPWELADVLVWAKMMAWNLSGNWNTEILRARLADRLTEEQLAQLWPQYPQDAPIKLPEFAADEHRLVFAQVSELLSFAATPELGSNAWVVSGEHTRSGMPLLANDPHLGLQAPSIWYLAHLAAPDYEVIGATLPGTPAVLLGHNTAFAWGMTNVGADVQDVYIERVDPADPTRYLTEEGSERFESRSELIRVRDARDVEITVRESRHGPIISDVSSAAAAAAGLEGPGHVAALRWTALESEDRSVEAMLDLPGAADWQSFRAALEVFHVAPQNTLYADSDGNIGYHVAGSIPVRSQGDGSVPVPGWTGEYDWEGYIPFEELPHTFNPAPGTIVSANQRIVPDDYPYLITRDWADPYRAERIHDLLDQLERHTVDSFARIQRDQVSLLAREFLPELLAVEPQAEQERLAHAQLIGWDGTMTRDGPEPLIFYAWYREFSRAVYADELGDLFTDAWGFRPLFMRSVLSEQQQWCDDVRTPAVESCAFQANVAFRRAVGFLTEAFGPDVEAWRWGDAHAARHEHRVFTGTPLEPFFDLVIEKGGDAFTVAAARFDMARERPFEQIAGATFRAIYDLENLDRSRFIHTTGQSGNPVSPHYRDLLEPFAQGQYLSMTTNRRDIERGSIGRLTLLPP